MPLPPFPDANAPGPQQKWTRALEGAVRAQDRAVETLRSQLASLASSKKGTTGRLQQQVRDLQVQADALQVQTNRVSDQADYLAGLVTVATTGNNFDAGNIPGDQTNRWYDADRSTSVQVRVPTGRLLVSFGCSSIELRAGNSTLYGMVRVNLSAPSGWNTQIGSATRLFAYIDNDVFGAPASSQRVIDGIPKGELITVQLQFGSWSAGTSPRGSVSWLSPFVSAQVIPS